MVNFATEAASLLPDLQDLRRRLHANPEVGLALPLTQASVLAALENLPLEITTGQATTSVVAVLRGTHPDRPVEVAPAVLLRGDMDALPIEELTEESFKSTNGMMHACGHDLHTAGLVGAARLLAAHREQLVGDVVFMFQPGEEGYNGASVMINEGVLDAAGPRVIAAFGAHVTTEGRGTFKTKPGTLQAGVNELHIVVHGRGGHGAKPESAVDPVPALAEIVTALQNMVTRRISVFDPIVMSVTQLSAGEAINVIPPSATLGATVRVLSAESLNIVRTQSEQIAAGIAQAHGCTAEVNFEVQYPLTVNDEAETAWTVEQISGLLGRERIELAKHPIMPSEDFAYVLERVPGTYLMLGAGRTDVPADKQGDNHSPFVVFDDSVLADQAAVLAHLACERLRKPM